MLADYWHPTGQRAGAAAVGRIVAAAPAGARARLAAVPRDLRRAATRATLTRFERAEVHAILDA
ncbi:MAG TPA: hypothetical protein VK735_27035, partial [Pseudonocardia sp.]|uniref:hypothetical protein n=1 Tax=Pseudonocardia sp. TaxID=60912 RepID=UPI002B555041